MIDIIGYISIFIVVISFVFEDVRLFRFLNTCGCLWFIVYGILISSKIVIIINSIIALINVFKLFKDFKSNEREN
jgi:hypothetical protein